MKYWNPIVFKHIGNVLGIYLEHDQSYETLGNMTMAHILVHLDTREGMEEKITLRWRNLSRRKNLDYEGVHLSVGVAIRLDIFTRITHFSYHLLLLHQSK